MNDWDRAVNFEGDSPATLLLELKNAVPRDFHGMQVVTLTISAANRDAFVRAVADLLAAPLCDSCGKNSADLPSRLCPGCQAYREHQS